MINSFMCLSFIKRIYQFFRSIRHKRIIDNRLVFEALESSYLTHLLIIIRLIAFLMWALMKDNMQKSFGV